MASPVRLTRTAARLLLLALAVTGFAHAQGTASQTIQFLPISDRPDTSAPFYVVAIASSDLPVTLTVQGPASLDDRRLLTLTGAGMVTLSATQPGNSQYAPASAQLSFNATPSASTIAWQPLAITYGMPLSAVGLSASASAIPLVDPQADTATVTMQLGTSQIAPGAPIPYPQTSAVLRYEGSTMAPSPYPADDGGYVPNGSAPPLGIVYRVAFTCVCEQFEYVVQSRQSTYRLSVDGAYTSLDSTSPSDSYPQTNFVRVQFPDKRARQIKVSFSGAPPFFGVVTANGDTIAPPQTPLGERVIVFGDSWTGPTIAPPMLPPAQDGLSGSGYAEYLGEYFNWDYWDSGVGGEGFTNAGTDGNGHAFPQRVLTDVCPFSPAAVLILGGVNDGSASEATAQAAINATLANLQTCLPGTPIYLYGPQFANAPIEAAFAAALPAFTGVHYVDVGQQAWLYGPETAADTGNEYLYFAGHPTPLGHNFLAEKMAIDLQTTYPTLAPAAYSLLASQPATGAFTYSAPATTLLPAGTDPVTATFTPTDAVNYAASTLQALVTVSKAATTTVLTSQSQAITVTVQPQIAGTPSGTVVVTEAGNILATLTLARGDASFSTATLANGAHSLTFAYSGDGNFTGSSQSTTLTVANVAPDFTVSASPTQLSVNPGAEGSVTLTVAPIGGLSATLRLSCSGLPANASCALASGGGTLAVGVAQSVAPVTASVTILTSTTTAAQLRPVPIQGGQLRSAPIQSATSSNAAPGQRSSSAPRSYDRAIALCGLLGAGLLATGRRRRWALSAAMLLVAVSLHGLTGCGGGGSTATTAPPSVPPPSTTAAPGTYTVDLQLTNTATPTMTHSVAVTLTIP